MKRTITGIQLHHHTDLETALVSAQNVCAGLRAAYVRTEDPAYVNLLEEAQALIQKLSLAHRIARRRFIEFHDRDPLGFNAARDGARPWPDETTHGFTPRCTCQDRCLIHDHGVAAPADQCNCLHTCPKHDKAPGLPWEREGA